jgi:hypothetical protein
VFVSNIIFAHKKIAISPLVRLRPQPARLLFNKLIPADMKSRLTELMEKSYILLPPQKLAGRMKTNLGFASEHLFFWHNSFTISA